MRKLLTLGTVIAALTGCTSNYAVMEPEVAAPVISIEEREPLKDAELDIELETSFFSSGEEVKINKLLEIGQKLVCEKNKFPNNKDFAKKELEYMLKPFEDSLK